MGLWMAKASVQGTKMVMETLVNSPEIIAATMGGEEIDGAMVEPPPPPAAFLGH